MTSNPKYAKNTTVPPEKTRAEIETLLRRYGATEFMSGWRDRCGIIGFQLRGIPIRIIVPLPDMAEFRFSGSGSSRRQRTQDGMRRAYEQAERQAWRALLLVTKAKLEAVETGITTLEQEFLAHVLLPSGNTIAEELMPQLERAVSDGRMPPMLPPGNTP